MARARAGDRDAYARLVHRHAPVALRTAALLGAGADAEDVVQEAFLKMHRGLAGFREGSPFRPWLLGIVANETRNLLRAAGRRARRERLVWDRTQRLVVGADQDDPAGAALGAERRAALVDGLGALGREHREVVVCRYLLDLDEAETAAALRLPRGTVKSRLHRALARLAQHVDAERAGAPGGEADR